MSFHSWGYLTFSHIMPSPPVQHHCCEFCRLLKLSCFFSLCADHCFLCRLVYMRIVFLKSLASLPKHTESSDNGKKNLAYQPAHSLSLSPKRYLLEVCEHRNLPQEFPANGTVMIPDRNCFCACQLGKNYFKYPEISLTGQVRPQET